MMKTAVFDYHTRESRKAARVPQCLVMFILVFSVLPYAYAESACKDTRLQVLGSGGPELDGARSSSAYLLWQGNSARLLMDTGSGSSVAFGKTGARFADLDAILLTHLHTDHSADLPSFIKGSFFTARVNDLVVAGPQGNDRMPDTVTFITRLIGPDGAFQYLSSYLDPTAEAYTLKPVNMPMRTRGHLGGDGWHATSLPVEHGPIPAVAWRLAIGNCVVVYAGDMSAAPQDFLAFANEADLLILHVAIPEDTGPAARQLHMTPGELASLTNQTAPRRVLLSHFMQRSEQTAAEQFESVDTQLTVAHDGLILELE